MTAARAPLAGTSIRSPARFPFNPSSGGQLELDLLSPSRLAQSRLDPLDPGEVDAVLVGEHAAHVDSRGLRPLGNADAPAFQVLRFRNRGIFGEVNRRV